MIKFLIVFAIGWFACIAVTGHRRRINGPRVEVFTQSGKRVR